MTDAVANARQQGPPTWPKDALRVSFGVIWLVDAVLKWLPGFRAGSGGDARCRGDSPAAEEFAA
jgi:hypothetical protein